MKKFAAIVALLCVFAVSGCNNGNPAGTSSDTASASDSADSSSEVTTAADGDDSSDGKVTEIAFQAPEREDTTEEALEFLERAAPPFRKYLDIRRTVPLTFEATVTHDDYQWKTAVYIKDATHFAEYSRDYNGNELTVIYDTDKAYQVDSASKSIYVYNCGADELKKTFEDISLAKIYYDDISSSTYEWGPLEYKGTEYDGVKISDDESTTTHYFDNDTGALIYTVSGESETKIDKLENTFTNDAVLELPSDYEMKTFEDLIAAYQEQAAAEQAAAQEESAE